MNQDDFVEAMSHLAKVHANIKRMGDIWRDEAIGLPIHMHGYSTGDGFVSVEKPKPCACGNPVFDISLSAGELIKKHEKGQSDESR